MRNDLTEGNILQKMLYVAVPVMGTQMIQMLYNLTDMFWLGRIGNEAVAASGTAGMYLWLSQAFMMVGRVGSEIGVSQSIGKRDQEEAQKYSQTSLSLAVCLGVLFALTMILFRSPLINFFQIQEAEVAADAKLYLTITGAAIPAAFVTSAISGTFIASGDSRTPFFINAVGLLVNIVLDPLLIFPAGLNVMGAAIATSIAQLLVAALMLIAVCRNKSRPFEKYRLFTAVEKERALQIFKWSIPVVLESMLFTLLSMIISRIVAGFGVTAIAVQKVGTQIESLSWLIGGGFASAVTAFMGQNYGAAKWSRVHRGIRISTITMLAWGVIVSAVLFLGGNFIFRLFLTDPEAIRMGTIFLKILAASQVINCLEYNSAGAFRGIGRTVPPSLASIGGNVIRVPMIYFLCRTALGIDGVWIGISLGSALRGIWLFTWFVIAARRLKKET